MRFTQSQVDAFLAHGETVFDGSWRGLLVRGKAEHGECAGTDKRQWLCCEIIAAAEDEWGQHCGAEEKDSDGRRGMMQAIKERVKERNKKCGFVIESIILAAILGWLVQRLLDWMFLSAAQDS